MRSISLLFVAALLALTPSCSLLSSLLKIPASAVQMATRTVGLSGLTDEAPQPEEDAELGALNEPAAEVDAVGNDQ
ncbi:hypothetical protein JIN77_11185 [Verrucomicrobiaceae bacterium R5-34]|uniref:Secreted protein n=1 Tax=Oceaniferula flava TaxID=2800421 RepID=A0AAE2V9N9_9BACT|nr:hypothetical protein [Oceaniferula flavus]MBK1831294.1 hypothetical protein [Verrucomicrobiaceae bacterium R5-34]MBK1855463.1 hypothetical protein [Oceaniferula flavus]MBM1136769.1 hypothetical protein [Oceaniferula flavus]